MLRVEGVVKSFDNFRAVDGAYLTVERGETVAVIGPNGAGKTTLFNLITGHLKQDTGKILFKGRDLLQADEESLRELRGKEVPVCTAGRAPPGYARGEDG